MAEVAWRSALGPAKDWGVLVVGGPVGGTEFIRYTLDTGPIQDTRTLLKTFPRLGARQEGLALLRSCGVGKLAYHLRVTPPGQALAAAVTFDALVAASFGQLSGIPIQELGSCRPGGSAWTVPLRQIQLPAKRSGFGLRKQEGLAPLCYLGSLAQCLGPITQAFPELAPHVELLTQDGAERLLPSL